MPTSETLSNKQRRTGLEFSNRVAALASEAPDVSTRRMLNKVVHSLRKRYGYSEEEKELEILKFIRDGAATVRELIDETGFPITRLPGRRRDSWTRARSEWSV
jgi:hypothetical protein